LIIEDLDVYPQLPRTTGAPTLNSEEPVNDGLYQGIATPEHGVNRGGGTAMLGCQGAKRYRFDAAGHNLVGGIANQRRARFVIKLSGSGHPAMVLVTIEITLL
uniref:hypothetical protein n=1 Tax=Kocuria carniphila TaxID=262208 RepID=UPI003F68A07C